MLAEVEAARAGLGVSAAALDGTADHPQARIVLANALASQPSHAYLFHGPSGVGKRTVARAFAAELLAAGSDDPDDVRLRVAHGTHPDLTWVRPSGAHVMRVDDVEEPVVRAATRTPFEASRRVFVLERVDTMNDEVANRLLKTLEEPASFVHLILMTDALGRVLETVVSRCQLVRFEPLPAERIAASLEARGRAFREALSCARLALGNAARALYLASPEGAEVRAEVDAFVAAALARDSAAASPGDPCWSEPSCAAPRRRRSWPRWLRHDSSSSRRAASAGRSSATSRSRRSATGAGRGRSRSTCR